MIVLLTAYQCTPLFAVSSTIQTRLLWNIVGVYKRKYERDAFEPFIVFESIKLTTECVTTSSHVSFLSSMGTFLPGIIVTGHCISRAVYTEGLRRLDGVNKQCLSCSLLVFQTRLSNGNRKLIVCLGSGWRYSEAPLTTRCFQRRETECVCLCLLTTPNCVNQR